MNEATLRLIIDMRMTETITEEQIIENYKGLRFMLKSLKDAYVIDRIVWKRLLDYAYERYITRMQQSISFHSAYFSAKDGDINE